MSALAVVAGPVLAACTADDPGRTDDARSSGSRPPVGPGDAMPSGGTGAAGSRAAGRRVLLAYFSRPGENYYYGGRRTLGTGNTERLAGIISDVIDCDVYRIDAAEPYPRGYDATVARNVREQDGDARPGIARPLPDTANYDTVLLASPVWNVRPPMIMRTFVDGVNLRGKVVLPVVTYAVSGLGSTEDDYRRAWPRSADRRRPRRAGREGRSVTYRGRGLAHPPRPRVTDGRVSCANCRFEIVCFGGRLEHSGAGRGAQVRVRGRR